MELSYYSLSKLNAMERAIKVALKVEADKEESDKPYMTDLTSMLGEVKCAISDKEFEEKALPFRMPFRLVNN